MDTQTAPTKTEASHVEHSDPHDENIGIEEKSKESKLRWQLNISMSLISNFSRENQSSSNLARHFASSS